MQSRRTARGALSTVRHKRSRLYDTYLNWKLVNFTYNNKQFSSSEQPYFNTMALKSKDVNSADKIITTTSPREIKLLIQTYFIQAKIYVTDTFMRVTLDCLAS